MKKYWQIITILIIIILIVLSILIYTKYFEEKIIFTLFGDKEITLYKGDEYIEYGYIALSENGDNLNSEVNVKSNLDVNKIGEYTIKYSIKTLFKTYHNERKIKVIEDVLENITFKLKGSSIVNLQVGEKYNDPKFSCVDKKTGKDLTKYVVIENTVNNQKDGVYEIIYRLRYDGKEKILTRTVYVYRQLNSHTISTTSLTNKPVSIQFKSNIYNFSHVICPNETIKYTNNFTYNFFENGKYIFYVFDSLNNYQEYVVTINNIDRTPPTGTCFAILENGQTSYTVKSSDTDIAKYLYHAENRYTSLKNNYVVPKYQRDASVMLLDQAGNKTLINCDISYKFKKQLNYLSKNEIDYRLESDSLVVNISYTDGYYLSHIWAYDPYLQMNKEMLDDNSKKLKLPKTILQQAIDKYNLSDKIVWSSNASAPVLKGTYYNNVYKKSSFYNLKEPSSLLVYNGDVIINDYKKYPASTVIYYVNASNELSYIPIIANKSVDERQEIFEKALDSGIRNTFVFNAVLVKNGQPQTVTNDYYALRNGFCQLDENNFISVVSDTRRWNKQDFASFMATLGCKTAVNFDGGGSNALFYKNRNNEDIITLTGNTRALSSVLYFTELN